MSTEEEKSKMNDREEISNLEKEICNLEDHADEGWSDITYDKLQIIIEELKNELTILKEKYYNKYIGHQNG